MSSKADSMLQKFGATIGQAVAQRPASVPSTASQTDKFADAVRARMFARVMRFRSRRCR